MTDMGYYHTTGRLTDGTYYKDYAFAFFKAHTGNSYRTHGLGPLPSKVGINRGARRKAQPLGLVEVYR